MKISGSLSLTKRVTPRTLWLLTENSVPFLWVVKHGSHWLVQGPLCNSTATRKGLMQVVVLPNIPKQWLVLLATLKTNATHATQGLDLVRKVDLVTPTLAETRRTRGFQIMERSISKPWDISLCSERKKKDLKDNYRFNPWNFWGIRGTYYDTFQTEIQDARKDIYF